MNTLSQENFERLLRWLCPDPKRAGDEYERIRNDLIKYFSSMLAWTVADDLADQCLDRVAKKVGSLPLYGEDPPNWKNLCSHLARLDRAASLSVGQRMLQLFPGALQEAIRTAGLTNDFSRLSKSEFLDALSEVLSCRDFYDAACFEGIIIADEARATLSRDVTTLSNEEVRKLNLLLLEAAFPADKLPYCKAVARYIYLEYLKSRASLTESVEDEKLERERQRLNPVPFNQEAEIERARQKDQMFECQEQCLQSLPEIERALIATYYRSCEPEETSKNVEAGGHIDNRKKLAERLGMSRNTLRVRLHRIRVILRQCIEECLQPKGREWNE